ncbi:MAG: DHH family phosphoesterase [Oscillospiraceae bacterium]
MTVKEASDFFIKNDNYDIICHISPDGDTTGSGYGLYYALKKIGKKVRVVCGDKIPKKFSYMLKNYVEEEFEVKFTISVDVADIKLIGNIKDNYESITLNIDHHVSHKEFADNVYLNTKASSNCENVLDIILEMGIELDKNISNCIYTGLITDTGCFRYENVNPNSHKKAALLIESGAEYDMIAYINFDCVTKEYVALESKVLSKLEYYIDNKCAFITILQEDIDQFNVDQSELDRVTAASSKIKGVECGVTIKQKNETCFKVSFRTTKNYEANKFAEYFGGGGHIRAAGCVVNGDIKSVKQQILEVLTKNIR